MEIDAALIAESVRQISQQQLMPLFNTVKREFKMDGSVVTRGDTLMQDEISKRLASLYPGVQLLGEEMPSDHQQALMQTDQPLWVLDPIDGSSNFAAGMPYFSVSLALVSEGEALFGLVYDPVLDEAFVAQKGQGATLNGEPLEATKIHLRLDQTLAFIDFKRLPPEMTARLVRDKPYGSQRNLGSIALELCWLAAGRAHVYLHGRQHLWDYAAAQLVLSEAGGFCATLDGDPLFDQSLKPRSACAAIDPDLFRDWCAYLDIECQH